MKYTLSFTIRADGETELEVFLQQAHEPYAAILQQNVKAGKSPTTYSFTNSQPAQNDTLYLTFMCGKAQGRTIYIDGVTLIESVP